MENADEALVADRNVLWHTETTARLQSDKAM